MARSQKVFAVLPLMGCLLALSILPAQAQQSGGSKPPPRKQEQAQKTFPLGASWVAVSLNGKAYSGDRPTLNVDENFRGRGFSGCNTFSASAYPLRQQAFAVGPFALTRKSCSAEVMNLEKAYLTALRTVQSWDIVGSTLIMKGQGGELRFERGL